MKRRDPRPSAPVVSCDFQSCNGRSVARIPGSSGLANVCARHYVELAQREADNYVQAQGLNGSVSDKVAFCRTMMKGFGKGGDFDSWAATVTQQTIAILVQIGSVKLLARLRAAGVIDDYNRLMRT